MLFEVFECGCLARRREQNISALAGLRSKFEEIIRVLRSEETLRIETREQ